MTQGTSGNYTISYILRSSVRYLTKKNGVEDIQNMISQ